jgi:hypothetical protein
VDVSVVIPTAGKWWRLEAGLAALAAQRVDAVWEVVLVADGVEPPPGLGDCLPGLRLLRLPTPLGRGGARNRGVRAARGEVVIHLDDDMVAVPGLVAAHLYQQRAGPGLCHGPIRELPALMHVRTPSPLRFAAELSARAAQRIEAQAARVLAALADPERCFEAHGSESWLEREGVRAHREGRMGAAWLAFAGANLSAPREWLLASPFDERAGTRWGLEDLALALRALLVQGRPLTIATGARGLHLTHPRGAWREDLTLSRGELDFLTEAAAQAVVGCLRGEVPVADMERELGTPATGAAWLRAEREIGHVESQGR